MRVDGVDRDEAHVAFDQAVRRDDAHSADHAFLDEARDDAQIVARDDQLIRRVGPKQLANLIDHLLAALLGVDLADHPRHDPALVLGRFERLEDRPAGFRAAEQDRPHRKRLMQQEPGWNRPHRDQQHRAEHGGQNDQRAGHHVRLGEESQYPGQSREGRRLDDRDRALRTAARDLECVSVDDEEADHPRDAVDQGVDDRDRRHVWRLQREVGEKTSQGAHDQVGDGEQRAAFADADRIALRSHARGQKHFSHERIAIRRVNRIQDFC